MKKTCCTKEPTGEQLRRQMWRDGFELLLYDLTEREASVLRMRYGLHDKTDYCYKEWEVSMQLDFNIAMLVSVEEGKEIPVMRIRQTERRAIHKLRQPDR